MQIPDAFDYDLPDSLIAQRPVRPYHQAKLLVVDRGAEQLTEQLRESDFWGLPEFLRADDLLVFNDSKVIPARFLGMLEGTQTSIEILLLKARGASDWEALGKPLKKLREGSKIIFQSGLYADVVERISQERIVIRFGAVQGDVSSLCKDVGIMPIPPYIRRGLADEADRQDYQSFFAKHDGSVAAPTASLHFTPELLSKIDAIGCQRVTITLHVGTASFVPLWHEHDQQLRTPEAESFQVAPEILQRIAETRKKGGRVIAVGTTVVRALESAAAKQSNQASLFITPGHRFSFVDAVMTNFHQPRTTHLLLVESLLGRTLLERAYKYALSHQFRFLSYGDGMLIV